MVVADVRLYEHTFIRKIMRTNVYGFEILIPIHTYLHEMPMYIFISCALLFNNLNFNGLTTRQLPTLCDTHTTTNKV